jgi:hypothetical protein
MWMMEHEHVENRMNDGTASRPFRKKLYRLVERAKCLRDITRMEARRFDDLWNGGQNKIMGPDGNMRYTQGLSYKLNDASCFERSLSEYHSYQAEESCYITTIEKVYVGGAYQLNGHEGERPMPPINGQYLKKYYTYPPIRFRRSNNGVDK